MKKLKYLKLLINTVLLKLLVNIIKNQQVKSIKWVFVKLNIQKQKNAYGISIKPLMEAYDSNKYFNDKLKQYCKLYQDIVNIVICHSLKSFWISIYYGSH